MNDSISPTHTGDESESKCQRTSPDNSDDDDEEADMIADDWLDEAITSKRNGNVEDCIRAHFQRMKACARFKTTDAIRLLGMRRDLEETVPAEFVDSGNEDHTPIEEISSRGVFEIQHDQRNTSGKFIPTRSARVLGKDIKELFFCRGYRLKACQSFLFPHIEDYDHDADEERIFSAQSFLQHRRDVYWARRRKNADSAEDPSLLGELEVLVWMFLFGLAIHRSEAIEVLGLNAVDILLRARLLRPSPVEPDTKLVAEVQIYPLDIGVFLPNIGDSKDDIQAEESFSLFVTDWNIESLRQTHNAIMPVGYDTLELLAVTVGEMVRQQRLIVDGTKRQVEATMPSQNLSSHKRILDLCCGCGIQGIFAWRCYMSCVSSSVEEASCALVLSDINTRAMHFVTANLAINEVQFATDIIPETQQDNLDCVQSDESTFGLCGDLFESFTNMQPSTFDFVLCNPPFVAIPSPTASDIHLKTPLYGVGGGLDGMICLRRILHKLYRHLSERNCQAMAIMVTEVPNVEESPAMVASFLPESDQARARIRIAYIQDDVETVEVYAKEREVEAGIDTDAHTAANHEGWLSSMKASGIYNRALVLISFARTPDSETDPEKLGLFKYESPEECTSYKITSNYFCSSNSDSIGVDPVDEQDMFLHHTGMEFARKALLFPPF
eukprot:jgi/Psemu1/4997/gm1.4997_g